MVNHEGLGEPINLAIPERRNALRSYFDLELQARPGTGAVVVVDLDDLKEVNDEYGHYEGDLYLKYAQEALSDCIEHESHANRDPEHTDKPIIEDGMVARASGDEYWLLLRGASSQEDVTSFIEYTQANLHDLGIGSSMGGQIHQPGKSAAEVIRHADIRMYLNKLERIPQLSPQDEATLLAINAALERIGVSARQLPKYLAAIAIRGGQKTELEYPAFLRRI